MWLLYCSVAMSLFRVEFLGFLLKKTLFLQVFVNLFPRGKKVVKDTKKDSIKRPFLRGCYTL